jgi:hypothetical protein
MAAENDRSVIFDLKYEPKFSGFHIREVARFQSPKSDNL